MTEAATLIPQIPVVEEPVSEVGQMSQIALMRLRFARNKLAMFGLFGLIVMYILVFAGPFVAPNEFTFQNTAYIFGGPSQFTFIGPNGHLGLYMYSTTTVLDTESFKFVLTVDRTKKLPVKLFVKGDAYTFLGFIPSNIHLFGVDLPQRVYLAGADSIGRDMFARTLVGGADLDDGWVTGRNHEHRARFGPWHSLWLLYGVSR